MSNEVSLLERSILFHIYLNNDKIYQCKHCKEKSEDRFKIVCHIIRDHLFYHHENLCLKCSRNFYSKGALANHSRYCVNSILKKKNRCQEKPVIKSVITLKVFKYKAYRLNSKRGNLVIKLIKCNEEPKNFTPFFIKDILK